MRKLKSVGQFLVALMLAVVLISFVSVDASAAGFGGGSRAGTFGTGGFGASTIKTELSYDALCNLCLIVNDQIIQGLYDSVEPFKSSSSDLAATVRYDAANELYVISVKSGSTYYNLKNNSGGLFVAYYETESVIEALFWSVDDLVKALTDEDGLFDLWFNLFETRLHQIDLTGQIISEQLDELIEAVKNLSISADGSTFNFDTTPITDKLDQVIAAIDSTPIVEALDGIYAELQYSGPVASGIWQPVTLFDYVMQGEMWLENIALDAGNLSSIASSGASMVQGITSLGGKLDAITNYISQSKDILTDISGDTGYLSAMKTQLVNMTSYLSSSNSLLSGILSDTGVLAGMNSRLTNIADLISTLANAEILRHNQLIVKFDELIDAVGTPVDPCTHEYIAAPVIAATCDLPGVDKYTCSLCGDFYYEDVAVLGHAWEMEGIGGSGSGTEVLLLAETEFAVEEGMLIDFALPEPHVPGELYRVTCDGVVYETFAYSLLGGYCVVLGDASFLGCPASPEPFFIMFRDGVDEAWQAMGLNHLSGDPDEKCALSVSRIESPSFERVTVVPLTDLVFSDDHFCFLPAFPMILGSTYSVVVDGVSYEGVCEVFGDEEFFYLACKFGDDFIIMSDFDGDGYCALTYSPLFSESSSIIIYQHEFDAVPAYSARFCSRCGTGENFSNLMQMLYNKTNYDDLTSRLDTIIDRLSVDRCTHEYTAAAVVAASCDLPGVDKYTCSLCGDFYYEDVAALGHAWISEGIGGSKEVVLLEETHFVADADSALVDFSLPEPLTPGILYRVTFDGVAYDCVAREEVRDVRGVKHRYVYLGNANAQGFGGAGEPFCFLYNRDTGSLSCNIGFLVSGEFRNKCDLSVSRMINVLYDKDVILPETVFELEFDGYCEFTGLSLIAGETYTVAYNGSVGDYVAYSFCDSDGNSLYLGSLDYTDPFIICNMLDEGASGYCAFIGNDGVNPSTMTIWHNKRVGSFAHSVRSCSRCGAGENFASLMHLLDDRLDFSSFGSGSSTDLTPLITRMDTIIESLGAEVGVAGCEHSYVTHVNQEQTCILPGLQTFTCELCSSSYSEVLESLGHDWLCTGHIDDELDPETGEVIRAGYDIYTCSRCDESYNDYEGTGTPEAENNTIVGIIGRVFEKIGSLVGELLAMAIRLLDKLLTGFDQIVTNFNEKTQQIVSFGGGYTEWLSGFWGIVPSDLQLALSFCVVVICLGIIGKKVVFAS